MTDPRIINMAHLFCQRLNDRFKEADRPDLTASFDANLTSAQNDGVEMGLGGVIITNALQRRSMTIQLSPTFLSLHPSGPFAQVEALLREAEREIWQQFHVHIGDRFEGSEFVKR